MPFVFEVTQPWSINTNPVIFGTAADLYITVDNGSASNAGQTYAWIDITNILFATIGGTFDLNSDGNQSPSPVLPSVPFLTTDATGLGTLNIDNSGANPAYFIAQLPGGGFAQFGAYQWANLAYLEGADFSDMAFFYVSGANWITTANPVQPNAPTVPEPTSLLLLGTGLGMVGLAAWRRRKF